MLCAGLKIFCVKNEAKLQINCVKINLNWRKTLTKEISIYFNAQKTHKYLDQSVLN